MVTIDFNDEPDRHALEQTMPALGPLQPVAHSCTAGNCPTVYKAATGAVVIQGYAVSADRAGVDIPAGEALVEIPAELLAEAVRHLR